MKSAGTALAMVTGIAAGLSASTVEEAAPERRSARQHAKHFRLHRPNQPGTRKVSKLMRRAMPHAFSVAERRA